MLSRWVNFWIHFVAPLSRRNLTSRDDPWILRHVDGKFHDELIFIRVPRPFPSLAFIRPEEAPYLPVVRHVDVFAVIFIAAGPYSFPRKLYGVHFDVDR